MITPELLTQLKQAAEKATPGPWEHKSATHLVLHDDGKADWFERFVIVNDDEAAKLNLDFIALANPQTVLELVAQLESARAVIQFYAQTPPNSGIIERQINGGEYLPLGTTARAWLDEVNACNESR